MLGRAVYFLGVLAFLLSATTRFAQGQGSQEEAPEVGEYDAIRNATKLAIGGEYATLAHAVRIPKSLFGPGSPCQILYLPNPDWVTVSVNVDFGSPAPSATSNETCVQMASIAYIDQWNIPYGLTGAGSANNVAWTSLNTMPTGQSDTPASDSTSSPPPASPPAASSTGPSRRSTMEFARPTERFVFGNDWDYVGDAGGYGKQLLWVDYANDKGFVPGPGSTIATPLLASSLMQRASDIPADQQPAIEYLMREATGTVRPDEEPQAGMLSGAARVFRPTMAECLDVLRSNAWQQAQPQPGSASASASPPTYAATAPDQPACFVTQQVVVLFNNCTAPAPVAGRASAPARPAAETCAQAAASGNLNQQRDCVLETELEKTAATIESDPYGDFVKVTVTYTPYDDCYRRTSMMMGQTTTMVLLLAMFCIAFFVLIVMLPTVYRLFLEFPARAIVYGIRKLINRRKADHLPIQQGLHSLKEPVTCYSCKRVPVLSTIFWLRKQLVYAVCTVHHPDGQFRALQVAVWSTVALTITVMAYPPGVRPQLTWLVTPVIFRIVKAKGDPWSTVWFFLQLLLFSLFLGFLGYMSLLANYNSPRNRYYVVQLALSVFWMVWLDAQVVAQMVGILYHWDVLKNRWPWIPMAVFQLGNLAVANVLQLVICFSVNDRNDIRHHNEYLAILKEVAEREEKAAARAKREAEEALLKKTTTGSRVVTAPIATATGAAIITAATASPTPTDADTSSNETQPPPATEKQPGGPLPPKPPPGAGIGRHRSDSVASLRRQPQPPDTPPNPGSPRVTGAQGLVGGAGSSRGDYGSARRGAQLADFSQHATNGDEAVSAPRAAGGSVSRTRVSPGDVPPLSTGSREFLDVVKAAAGPGRPVAEGTEEHVVVGGGEGDDRRSVSSGSSSSSSSSGGRRGRAREVMRKLFKPLSEDAAFRFPAWFIASLLVAAYVLIFTYAKAMVWANVIQDCIADPTDCLSQNLNKYVLFATRVASREEQSRLRQTLVAVLDTRTLVESSVNRALNGSDTLLIDDPVVQSALNVTGLNVSTLTTQVADTLVAQLSVNFTQMLNDTLGPDNVAVLSPAVLALMSERMNAAVRQNVAAASSHIINKTIPAAIQQQNKLLTAINGSLGPMYDNLGKASSYMSIALTVQTELVSWKDGLERRFFGCSVAGFTLGLLLGLYSLLQTAVSFRRSSRRIALARLSHRIFAAANPHLAEEMVEPTDSEVMLLQDGGQGMPGCEQAINPVVARALARKNKGWANTNFVTVFDDPESIVHRSQHENIAFVVYFIGVLLSVAVIQLYVVGVVLTISLALVTHPWLWTWFMPRYVMWLVAILVGLILNKVILIAYIGGTFLSNGDRIHRPAAWLAFLVIASATNLVIGLLLALFRIILLLVTTIFALGKLDVTLFTILPSLDLPHRTFLAGLHLNASMSHFNDPIYLPGPRGRAHRRWRKLQLVVSELSAEELRRLLVGCAAAGRKSVSSDAGPGGVQVLVPSDDPLQPPKQTGLGLSRRNHP